MYQSQNVESYTAEEPLQTVYERNDGLSIVGTRFFAGGVAGAGAGVLAGLGLLSGGVPGMEMAAAFGTTLPVMLGVFSAGIGTLLGSFFDISEKR